MKITVGDRVRPSIGPHRGRLCTVIRAEMEKGAYNGWFTVVNPEGATLMFAGEELTLS